MNFLLTLLAFVVALAPLVVVHELGHYWMARCCGVKVLRFSVGMGRVIWSRRCGRDQTEWALSMLPLGGYVKMLDARAQDVSQMTVQDLSREFTRQSVWRRIAIVAAGPLANFMLAILLFAALFMHGLPEPLPKVRAMSSHSAAYLAGLRGGETITAINGMAVRTWSEVRWQLMTHVLEQRPVRLEVEQVTVGATGVKPRHSVQLSLDAISSADLEHDFLAKLGLSLALPPALLGRVMDGPAQRAGLQKGDLILAVNDVPIQDGQALVALIRSSPNQPLRLDGLRAQQPFRVLVTPDSVTDNGQMIGRIKVEVPLAPEMTVISDGPWTALRKGMTKTWDTSLMSLKMIGKMILGQVSWKNINGPLTIADYAGQTAKVGLVSYLSFIAFISISLGVMNLLPIPVLDGGYLLYYSLEILTGRPVSARVGEMAQRVGLGILITLMLVAVFNDIVRLMF